VAFHGDMKPRPWTHPVPRALVPPDPFLSRRLRLTDAWLAESGEWRPLADEPSAGLWSILAYLRWYAPALMRTRAAPISTGEVDEWLRSQPLVAAIEAELAARGETPPGQALAVLAAIGLAPWQLPTPLRRRTAAGR
jgi:hypothetical protein